MHWQNWNSCCWNHFPLIFQDLTGEFSSLRGVSFKPSHIRRSDFKCTKGPWQVLWVSSLLITSWCCWQMAMALMRRWVGWQWGLCMCFSHLYQKHVGHTLVFIVCVSLLRLIMLAMTFLVNCIHLVSQNLHELSPIDISSDTYPYVDRNLTDQSCKPISSMNVYILNMAVWNANRSPNFPPWGFPGQMEENQRTCGKTARNSLFVRCNFPSWLSSIFFTWSLTSHLGGEVASWHKPLFDFNLT